MFQGAAGPAAPGPRTHSSPSWLLRGPVHGGAGPLRTPLRAVSPLAVGVLGTQRRAAHHGPVVHALVAPQSQDLHGPAGAGGGHLPRHLRQLPDLRPGRGALRLHRSSRAAPDRHQGGGSGARAAARHADAAVRGRRRLRVRGRLPDDVRPDGEAVQGGAASAQPGEGLRRPEGLSPAGGAVGAEGGAGAAAVRLHGSERQRRTDEHGALAHPQQPKGSAVETDLAHQGLVTMGGGGEGGGRGRSQSAPGEPRFAML